MREIKFRLRFENKIVGYEKWYPGDRKEFKAKPCWLYSKDGKYWNPEYIPHAFKDQYIGLKDKNGKEIYEGDIVKTKDYGPFVVKFGDTNISDNENYGDNNVIGFYLVCKKEDRHVDYLYEKDVEIIGDIYENPELLKGE